MKKQTAGFAAVLICLCMTGCSGGEQLTTQQDRIPIVPAQTSQIGVTEANPVSQTAAQTVMTGTSLKNTGTASAASGTSSATAAVTTAASAQTSEKPSDQTAGNYNSDSLYGKWDTVSFSKNTGESVSYNLSDPVHRSYYVGLDLQSTGQSALILGTEHHAATIAVKDNTLSVWRADRKSGSLDFQFSKDKSRMTVSLLDGRIVATLKPVRENFSIIPYQDTADEPACPFSASDLTGEWSMPGVFGTRNNSMHIGADGSVIMRYAAGGTRRSTVRIDKAEQSDGSYSFLYALCDDSGNAWMRFPCIAVSADHLYAEQEEGTEFVRLSFGEVAVGKMDNLSFLMSCTNGGGGELEIDRETTVNAASETGGPDLIYALVKDERFAINSLGKAAFERLIEETLSGEEKTRWQNMIDYSFVEQDGLLYVLISEARGSYSFDTGHGVTVTDQTDNSFRAATVDSNQMYGRGSARFVFDGINWTIESYEFA